MKHFVFETYVSAASRGRRLGWQTVTLAAALLLPSPAFGQTVWDDAVLKAPERQAPKPATDAELVATARTMLEDNLVDYSKARLKDIRLVRSVVDATDAKSSYIPAGRPVAAFCGKINTPNAMGGMTGWRHFALIVEGRAHNPIVVVAPNGYSGLSEVSSVCTITGPSGSIGPASAQVDPTDWTAALSPLQPVATNP